ncbi:MAG: hypothetical protein KAV82_12150 [Phycisphaerae bacterium]|nr:hypothetical protein [Phycisphaerae bacterium]
MKTKQSFPRLSSWLCVIAGLCMGFVGCAYGTAANGDEPIPPTSAMGAPSGGGPFVRSMNNNQERVWFFWGRLWYAQGSSIYDDDTLVEGGAEGSAIMVYREQDRTQWTFLDGKHMFLRRRGMPKWKVTTTPGVTYKSLAGGNWTPENSLTPEELNLRLLKVFGYSRASGSPPIRHVPFLDVDGWPHPHDQTGKGAWHETARRFLEAMNLTMEVLPDLNGNIPGSGYVKYQNPPGGTFLRAGSCDMVYVILDGSVDVPTGKANPAETGGDYLADATVMKMGKVTGSTVSRHDKFSPACAWEGSPRYPAPDVVWELPSSAAGKPVNIEALTENLCLSAWKVQKPGTGNANVSVPEMIACAAGDHAMLKFHAPGSDYLCYVVAEDVLGAPVLVKLDTKW